jgi:hypothetical protein
MARYFTADRFRNSFRRLLQPVFHSKRYVLCIHFSDVSPSGTILLNAHMAREFPPGRLHAVLDVSCGCVGVGLDKYLNDDPQICPGKEIGRPIDGKFDLSRAVGCIRKVSLQTLTFSTLLSDDMPDVREWSGFPVDCVNPSFAAAADRPPVERKPVSHGILTEVSVYSSTQSNFATTTSVLLLAREVSSMSRYRNCLLTSP